MAMISDDTEQDEVFLDSILTSWLLALKRSFSWKSEGRKLLELATSILKLEWGSVFLLEGNVLQCSAEWPPHKEGLCGERILLEEFPWLRERIEEGNTLFLSTLRDLPQEAWQERAFFESRAIRSLGFLPLTADREPLGAMVLATLTREKQWDERARKYLDSLSRLLAYTGETSQVVEELRREREFLRLILEEMPDTIIFLKDRESRFLWTSNFHLKILGISRVEEVIGKTDFDFFPEEQAREFFRDEQRVMETGEILIDKLERVYFADGTLHWVLTTKIPVRDEKGDITGVLGISRDVTHLKELEEKLSWERNLLLAIINAIPDHIYVKDREHRFLLVNRACTRHLGFSSPEKLIGKTDFDLHPPELARAYWEEEEGILTTGGATLNIERQADDFSTGVRKKIWITVHKVPVHNEEGKIVGMVGINRDITERKLMEEALRDSEREKVLILNALEDLVTYFEPDLRVVWANEAVFRNFGFAPQDFIGKQCHEVVERRNTPCPGCAVIRTFQSGRPEEGEVVSRDGTVWHQKAYPIFDDQGKVFRVVEVASNITERKKAEERIRYLTFHDSLTGLYNRFFFQEELKRLDTPRQLPLSIIMADVNNLKLMNDAFGHQKGDELLQRVASVLSRSCRKEDIVTRWGGDEFLILLPRTPSTIAQEIAERIRQLCQEESKTGDYIPVSIALGYATKEREEEDIQRTLSEAESRMYQNKLADAHSTRLALIFSLEQSLREIPGETETHYQRMREMVQKTGSALHLSPAELNALDLLARFHDLGKLGISRDILMKTGPLDEKDREEIKKHPEIGYRVAQALPELLPVAEGILAHHEHFDGSGYPRGLKGGEIPLIARIIAIVDAFEVLTSGRLYQKALTKEEALKEIQRNAWTQFDPWIVQVFLKVMS